MINDDDFILELQQQTTDTVNKPSKEEKKTRKADDEYQYVRDEDKELSLSAHYGSENDQMDEGDDEEIED